MNCREFKSKHVGFIDDVLSAFDMRAMRQHVSACPSCASLDVRIRRSLLVMRNLPQIEPSADFFSRLNEELGKGLPPSRESSRQPLALGTVATFALTTALLAAAVYFAMPIGTSAEKPAEVRQVATTASVANPVQTTPDAAMAAAAPAGIPIWPAMFMVGELPMRLASAELLDEGLAR
jgi:hypothetical protein